MKITVQDVGSWQRLKHRTSLCCTPAPDQEAPTESQGLQWETKANLRLYLRGSLHTYQSASPFRGHNARRHRIKEENFILLSASGGSVHDQLAPSRNVGGRAWQRDGTRLMAKRKQRN